MKNIFIVSNNNINNNNFLFNSWIQCKTQTKVTNKNYFQKNLLTCVTVSFQMEHSSDLTRQEHGPLPRKKIEGAEPLCPSPAAALCCTGPLGFSHQLTGPFQNSMRWSSVIYRHTSQLWHQRLKKIDMTERSLSCKDDHLFWDKEVSRAVYFFFQNGQNQQTVDLIPILSYSVLLSVIQEPLCMI